MWRRSLDGGVVPSYYKLSLVTPLHKKGDKVLPGNYRPVSLTSYIVKVFERAWMSLPLCGETFLSERGERFKVF